jgi:anti-sigma factor RsiW
MTAAELECRELVELVTDYLEDAMDDATRRRFDEHLAACSSCRTYIAQFRETIRLTGALSDNDISIEARDALLRVLRAWKRG